MHANLYFGNGTNAKSMETMQILKLRILIALIFSVIVTCRTANYDLLKNLAGQPLNEYSRLWNIGKIMVLSY